MPKPSDTGRILVVIQLTGGNDGLNTVVPYRSDAYYKARPTIAVPRNQTLALNNDIGLHPQLKGLKSLFDKGVLTVIQGVGYPNPDRSHFSAMDIWHCADPTRTHMDTGWLGRAADTRPSARAPFAVHLDDDAMPLALRGRAGSPPSIHDISSLKLEGAAPELRAAVAASRDRANESLLYVQRAAVAACETARRLESIPHADSQSAAYPATDLARKLRQIAQLIGADFGATVYYTSLAGFDTHSKQLVIHGSLMAELGDALLAFVQDLKARRLEQRVLVMTFSEFGRRVAENGSQGTDHGAAAPMFLIGPAAKGGVVGPSPDFDKLTDGDIRHQIDFRSVYATILDQYLKINARGVLEKNFATQPLLKI